MDTTPTSRSDLDATTLPDLKDVEPGDEIWIPVSPIREDKFRAVRVEVKERASIGGYEEIHALADDKWSEDKTTTITGPAENHQIAHNM